MPHILPNPMMSLLHPFSLRYPGWRKNDAPEILFRSVGFDGLLSVGAGLVLRRTAAMNMA